MNRVAAAHLPPEVLLHILSLIVPVRLDNVYYDPGDNSGFYDNKLDRSRYPIYAACARVCKSWYTMAIPLLYHTIDLISPAANFLFYETIAMHNTTLAKYVHEYTGLNVWLDECSVQEETTLPNYLARSLLRSLPTTKNLHLNTQFIPHLDQITSSKAGRNILEVSGHDDLHDDTERLYHPLKSVLVALPSRLSSLILRHFEGNDELDESDLDGFGFNSTEGSDSDEGSYTYEDFEFDYETRTEHWVFPRLNAFEMSACVLWPGLARRIATQAATLRCLTLSNMFAYVHVGPGSLQSMLHYILKSVGLYLEELSLTTYGENLLLTSNLLCLVPKLRKLRYKCGEILHIPDSALLENLPKSLQALTLGFDLSDTSFVADLFSALRKPSLLPDLATIPQIFLGGPPVDLSATYSYFHGQLGEKRDRALASLRARHLEWKSDGRGYRDWPSDSHRWSNSIWMQDFTETLSVA